MTYIILAGGPFEHVPSLSEFCTRYSNPIWIGVDRGVLFLLKNNIVPAHAFGDFDSLSEEEKAWVESHHVELSVYPEEKGSTDMEIAIDWAIDQNPKKIIILGATGGRLDHTLINLQFLQKGLKKKTNMQIEDRWNRITAKDPGEYIIEKSDYKYISFIPITTKVKEVHLKGFRYPLKGAEVKQAVSLTVSNEIVESEGILSFQTGKLLVIESRDKNR